MQGMVRKPGQYAIVAAAAAAVVAAVMSTAAEAYVGPGTGLSAIGALLALVAAIALGVIGFVWYPVKRLLRHRSQSPGRAPSAAPKRRP